MKIGVFDSGKGGLAVAERLHELLPEADTQFVDDHEHMPYGGRAEDEIIRLTDTAIQPLLQAKCDVIVIACNTATTVAISTLRERYPSQQFIGLEPMVKPAALTTKTGKIAVLATPATLASARYHLLKQEWATDLTIIEPDCSTWADLIEHDRATEIPLAETILPLIQQDIDVVVLACTHYHWLTSDIEALVGENVHVLEPSDAIKERITNLLG